MFRKIAGFSTIFSLLFLQFSAISNALTTEADLISSVSQSGEYDFTITYNTTDYNTLLNGRSAGSIIIMKDTSRLVTLDSWTYGERPISSVSWDGKSSLCGTSDNVCPDGSDYSVVVGVNCDIGSGDFLAETHQEYFEIGQTSSFTLDTFALSVSDGESYLDPSPSGNDAHLEIMYKFSDTADSMAITIENEDEELYKTIAETTVLDGLSTWDGNYATRLVKPGEYTATITATKSGFTTLTDSETFTVAYNDMDRPDISGFSVDPSSFDPDYEDTVISFTNDESAYLELEIRNASGDTVKAFSDYNYDQYNSNTDHDVSWDGRNSSGSNISNGTYVVNLSAWNGYGVTEQETSVTLSGSGSSSSSNIHIGDISISPSSFEPVEDGEVDIEFDIKEDLDELIVNAVQGATVIEIFNEDDLDEESNFEFSWDGEDDDGDLVDDGSWRIEFLSEKDGQNLTAYDTFKVVYAEPEIKDLYVSKEKFDNDLGEFTYVIFEIDDSDALVDIEIWEDGDKDDTFIEEMDVEEDQLYAVMWDGDRYDYDDDLDINVKACNPEKEDICNSEKISIDLSEDDVSSTKSNVTN
ncbi:hypothetical protein GF354_01625, partial [Candidatus Peregrinibacteria bacterium]|nr:hypothetical protein [Candidatus Peregrinibacteria bacterium]